MHTTSKSHVKSLLTIIMIMIGINIGLIGQTRDNVAPSVDPPGGLARTEVPLFINIGFDDNMFADSIHWLLDVLATKTNPAGNGNAATYDGTPVKVSFYNIAMYGDEMGQDLVDSWQRAKNEGHEIGCHTYSHADTLKNADVATWQGEIEKANLWHVNNLGIPQSDIQGFRTPYLAYNTNTFAAMAQSGIVYDCSVEHPNDPYTNEFLWPYTLDNGVDPVTQKNIGKYPGLWEIPVYSVLMDPSGYPLLTGFDYNIWARQYSKEEALNVLKSTLDHRLKPGQNRAPMTLGAHTDYYTPLNTDKHVQSWPCTWEQRRQVIEEFIDYALTKPEVRIVTAVDIIKWMRNPVALDDITVPPTPTIPPTATPTATPSLVNVGLKKPVFVSGEFSADFPKTAINDGNDATVWGSKYNAGPQWAFIDLGQPMPVENVVVKFFNPYYSPHYFIGISNDAQTWEFAAEIPNSTGGNATHSIKRSARYVGIYLTKGAKKAYGIKEFEVNSLIMPPTPTPTVSPTPTATPEPSPTVPPVETWKVGVAYEVGAIVSYNGKNWECLNQHTSIADWYPGAPGVHIWKQL